MPRLSDLVQGHTCVDVAVLPTGSLALPRKWLIEGRHDDNSIRCPDFTFLVEHPSGKKILFDLGLRKDLDAYPPLITANAAADDPICEFDAADLLKQANVQPEEIDVVILSHPHWDHIGNIQQFPNAELILGPGTMKVFPGYPENPNSPFLTSSVQPPSGRLNVLPDSDPALWKALGEKDLVWPRVYDYFGDNSLYLLDSPGHMVGHLMALARTGENEFIIMGGDGCHDRLLFAHPSRYTISTSYGPFPLKSGKGASMHTDIDAAKKTIKGLSTFHEYDDVLVLIAHDYATNEIVDFFPKRINGWSSTNLKANIAAIADKLEKDDIQRSYNCCS